MVTDKWVKLSPDPNLGQGWVHWFIHVLFITQSEVHEHEPSVSPGNFLERQVLWPIPRSIHFSQTPRSAYSPLRSTASVRTARGKEEAWVSCWRESSDTVTRCPDWFLNLRPLSGNWGRRLGCSASGEQGPQSGWARPVCRFHKCVSKGWVSEMQPGLTALSRGQGGNKSSPRKSGEKEAKTGYAASESQSLENKRLKRNRRETSH